jgi:hypothetical protein
MRDLPMVIESSLLIQPGAMRKLAGTPPERREHFQAALGAALENLDRAELLASQVQSLVQTVNAARQNPAQLDDLATGTPARS